MRLQMEIEMGEKNNLEEKLYTSEEVTDIMGFSIATLNRCRAKGFVTPIRRNGRLFYPEDEVRKLLESPFALLHDRTEEVHYTPKEVCDLLNISIATLNRRRARGEITPKKCGQKMFYPASEVDKVFKQMLEEYNSRPECVKKKFLVERYE